MEDDSILATGEMLGYFIWIIGVTVLALHTIQFSIHLAITLFFISVLGLPSLGKFYKYWELNVRESSESR